MTVTLYNADCLGIMPTLDSDSIDSIVTDPPYGLSFMGKDWDYGIPGERFWREALRVAKPGAYLLAFGGTRTFHRLAVAIEDAGWEIRDTVGWIYGSGFPKSHNVSKAIDKANGETWRMLKFTRWMRSTGVTAKQINDATGTYMGSHYLTNKTQPAIPTPELWAKLRPLCGDIPGWVDELVERIEAEREVVGQSENGIAGGTHKHAGTDGAWGFNGEYNITAPATDAARQWDGWGTALKPAIEKIIVARKPLGDSRERDIIVGNLYRMEAQLWLLLRASTAGKSSELSRREYDEALSIAQWSADVLTSTLADLSGQMDMSQLRSVVSSSLSIVSSWRITWEEAWKRGSTFIIETVTSPIIDLKILRYSASALTPRSIIQDVMNQPGPELSASTAVRILSAASVKLSATLELFAVENAIDKGHIASPDAIDQMILDRTVIVARKPLIGTVAENVLAYGTGAINVDACRVGTEGGETHKGGYQNAMFGGKVARGGVESDYSPQGRWPANLIHDGSDEVTELFPVSKSATHKGPTIGNHFTAGNAGEATRIVYPNGAPYAGDTGSAARFFYCAKASKRDRDEGCDGLEERDAGKWNGGGIGERRKQAGQEKSRNHHPTVKPTELMRYLCRLVTQPGGIVLDPFMGSGSTGKAAVSEGFNFVGIELDKEYCEIAERRIAEAQMQLRLVDA
jgi:DNA modification methylase